MYYLTLLTAIMFLFVLLTFFKKYNDFTNMLENDTTYKRINNFIFLKSKCKSDISDRINFRIEKEYIQLMNKLSCSCRGVGYWGGFCLNISKARKMFVGCDLDLANKLSELFKGKKVVDLGGGLGWYCKIIGGKAESCDEYDGSVNIEEATNGTVKYLNLAEPINFECNYDIAMSIEVAEHIPKEYENIYINNLLKCGKEAILISWSRMGQGGYFHVNNKNKQDVIQIFEKRSLKYNNKITEAIKKSTKFIWIKRNILYFDRINI